MMYIQFDCRECGKSIEFSQAKLIQASSVHCPECGARLNSSFLNLLQEVCMQVDGQSFDISFSEK